MHTTKMQYEVKKGLLGHYKVYYQCHSCSTPLTSPLDDAGKSDTCPQCAAPFVVPGIDERERIHKEDTIRQQEQKERDKEALRQKQEQELRIEIERQRRYALKAQENNSDEKLKQVQPLAQQQRIKHCPYCGEEILAVANKCKYCGEYLNKPKHISLGSGCLVIVLIAIALAVVMPSAPESEDRKMSTASPAVTSSPSVRNIDQSPDMQQKRAEFIVRMETEGLFYKVELPGGLPMPVVWVTPAFRALNFDDKQSFISVVYAYYAPVELVAINDSISGEQIGIYSPENGLRIE